MYGPFGQGVSVLNMGDIGSLADVQGTESRDGIGCKEGGVRLSPLDTEGVCQWMVSDLSEEGYLPL